MGLLYVLVRHGLASIGALIARYRIVNAPRNSLGALRAAARASAGSPKA